MNEVIYLYDTNGNVSIYKDKKEAALKLGYGFIANSVGDYLGNPCNDDGYYRNNYRKKYSNFILRNEYGEVLTFGDFAIVFAEIREEKDSKTKSPWDRLAYWNGTGPVPRTGKRVYGRYYRHPKTLKTLKYATGVYEEFEPRTKIRGGKSSVPTAWDDYVINISRNWKNFRKEQYKIKKTT